MSPRRITKSSASSLISCSSATKLSSSSPSSSSSSFPLLLVLISRHLLVPLPCSCFFSNESPLRLDVLRERHEETNASSSIRTFFARLSQELLSPPPFASCFQAVLPREELERGVTPASLAPTTTGGSVLPLLSGRADLAGDEALRTWSAWPLRWWRWLKVELGRSFRSLAGHCEGTATPRGLSHALGPNSSSAERQAAVDR